jgi:hypothetical protein
MIDFNMILKTNSIRIIIACVIFTYACSQKTQDKKLIESNTSIESNIDSLVNVLFDYGQQYFFNNNIDSILAKFGNPVNSYKTQWCAGICNDSLLTSFEYSGLTLKFFERDNSKIELESIHILDKKTSFPANLTIGKTTRQEILQILGLPDFDHNDPGKSMNKSCDTTVYGKHSGAGDTVTFVYSINIDEYAIGLSMTKDTLRKISWTKNMN